MSGFIDDFNLKNNEGGDIGGGQGVKTLCNANNHGKPVVVLVCRMKGRGVNGTTFRSSKMTY